MNIFTNLVARLLYGIPFAVFGIMHFLNAGSMANFVPSWVPGGVFWVYLTGLAMIAAAVSIIIEKRTHLAGILLGILLLIFVLTIHLPGVLGGAMEQSMPNLLKDMALAGAAWYIAGQYESGGKSAASESAGPATDTFEE